VDVDGGDDLAIGAATGAATDEILGELLADPGVTVAPDVP
jgi:hypothetical protein